MEESIDLFARFSLDGKYDALQLYREVDVLRLFKDQGERDLPGIAALARIGLGKNHYLPLHNLSGYVVSELRTQLDGDRAGMLCLMIANWREYNWVKFGPYSEDVLTQIKHGIMNMMYARVNPTILYIVASSRVSVVMEGGRSCVTFSFRIWIDARICG
ncbi:hypothetical protein GQ600_7609 [Phytophthora cactorum]|nr:hypothetical protein GQ600_7609 [Phytophthora cactorum]